MKRENDLPESARNAFNDYPHLQPSPAFNRAVLESLASAQSQRRQSLIGKTEEFLGLGLWQFLASGALGALCPVIVLGGLLWSSTPPPDTEPLPDSPITMPGLSPFNEVYRREYELV
ncbi:hypothetical protein EON83_05430 [bacterium]|nr:MAG: hypothetical protein EON83_05430 [bacterium]